VRQERVQRPEDARVQLRQHEIGIWRPTACCNLVVTPQCPSGVQLVWRYG